METFNNIKPGEYIWFSKDGAIGQVRVVDTDKENNKLKYQYLDNGRSWKTIEMDFDYSKNSNDGFYATAQDAFNASQRYNNLHIKNISIDGNITYKTPEEISNTQINTMLLD